MPLPTGAADLPRSIFSGIATNYDLPAQLFSLFQYRRWHRILLSQLSLAPPVRILDMATGTGALALRLAERQGVEVIAADITRPMLLKAKARAKTGHPDFLECTAEASPFVDNVFDAIIFAYLLRYVADVPSTLREMARLIRPGGVMLSLDFAVPPGVAYPLWRLHTGLVLPLGGALLSPGWRRVGSFLGPSIRDFYRRWPEDRLLQAWRDCGFPDVQARRLSLGGALIVWGTKAP